MVLIVLRGATVRRLTCNPSDFIENRLPMRFHKTFKKIPNALAFPTVQIQSFGMMLDFFRQRSQVSVQLAERGNLVLFSSSEVGAKP